MPELHETTYSREATIAAVREYYRFLTRMYLKESYIAEPPQGGWPEISRETIGALGKTDEVISLLRHLPYVESNNECEAQGAAMCRFADWRDVARQVSIGELPAGDVGFTIERELPQHIYSHVVAVTDGDYYNPAFLLDTKLGIVYWYECHSDIQESPPREPVMGQEYDGFDDIPGDEADWRSGSVAWAIPDFFELFKDLFRQLFYIPVSPRKVCYARPLEGRLVLADIYRAYGWPDLERYDKKACLKAVQDLMEERWPGEADRRERDE
ncbi:hypothetical protein N657DRAFT_642419 [Parathielavia appendiculata]|uniref:Uncharacterized protein n=1 Tax=Parathielavia appendiculata TaxID=2587402 RepID=A0AAN6U489_9PEZI|nr:hypothetical protein N657DRAFT_642419 [Parathielavia appendiculata]